MKPHAGGGRVATGIANILKYDLLLKEFDVKTIRVILLIIVFYVLLGKPDHVVLGADIFNNFTYNVMLSTSPTASQQMQQELRREEQENFLQSIQPQAGRELIDDSKWVEFRKGIKELESLDVASDDAVKPVK